MSSIDPTSQFLAQITEQLSGVARQMSKDPSAAAVRSAAQGRSTASAGAPRDIDSLIASRVQAIDPDDPGRRRKAFRVFLESVLVNELGEQLINDPGFHQLIDNVQHTMQRDKELASAIDKAGEFLLTLAKSGQQRN